MNLKNNIMKTGSDFSGVGAFDQALIRLGVKQDKIFACDMDKFARQTYILNYGEPAYYPENVYDRNIPKEPLDIYMTSPPCQSFSIAGSRKGENSDKGVLFYNSHELIKKNKPRYFIFENVKGLLSDNNGKTFGKWVDMLGGRSVNGLPVIFPHKESVPYHLYYQVLNAKNFGVPQNRERIFIIGIRDDIDNKFQFPKPIPLDKNIGSILEKKVDEKYFLSKKLIDCFEKHKERHDVLGNGFGFNIKELSEIACTVSTRSGSRATDNFINISFNIPGTHEQSTRVYNTIGISPTLTTMIGGGQEPKILLKNIIRKLTPKECFRLMDFDESFKWNVSDSQAYKQAGNSIVVSCLVGILKNLL